MYPWHIYIYIYMKIYVCVCVYINNNWKVIKHKQNIPPVSFKAYQSDFSTPSRYPLGNSLTLILVLAFCFHHNRTPPIATTFLFSSERPYFLISSGLYLHPSLLVFHSAPHCWHEKKPQTRDVVFYHRHFYWFCIIVPQTQILLAKKATVLDRQ